MHTDVRGLLYTLALGIPTLAGALLLVAFLDENMGALAGQIRIDLPALANEFSARWPEAAGMVIGQLLIMVILLVAGARLWGRSSETG